MGTCQCLLIGYSGRFQMLAGASAIRALPDIGGVASNFRFVPKPDITVSRKRTFNVARLIESAPLIALILASGYWAKISATDS